MPIDRPRHTALQTRIFHIDGGDFYSTKPGIVGDLEWICHLVATAHPTPLVADAINRLRKEAVPRLETEPMPDDAHLVDAYQQLRRENAQNRKNLCHQSTRNTRLLQTIVSMGDELSNARLPTPTIYLEAVSDVGRPLTDAEQAAQDAGWKELMDSMPPGERRD